MDTFKDIPVPGLLYKISPSKLISINVGATVIQLKVELTFSHNDDVFATLLNGVGFFVNSFRQTFFAVTKLCKFFANGMLQRDLDEILGQII